MTRAEHEQYPRFPFARGVFDPPEAYAAFRKEAPFTKVRLWDGSLCWLVTSHEDVRKVLRDDRFSRVPTNPGYPSVTESRAVVLTGEQQTFIRMDPPEHTRLRRMLTKEFTVARIRDMRNDVQEIADDLLEKMMAGTAPVDFVEAFALPIPSIVISRILGVPYEDRAFFHDCARKRSDVTGDPEVTLMAGQQMRDYLSDLLASKEKDPESHDDILGHLAAEQIRPGHLDRDEAVRMAELLLFAGHDTTANMIALGTLSLLREPDQFRLLREQPELSAQAVEEMLRYHTITQFSSSRVAIEDVEINGYTIRAGEGVLASLNSANRDGKVFPDPDVFDIRKPVSPHVAFGFGVHQCIGQPLARLELDVVFKTLPRRMPTLRLAVPEDQIRFKKNVLVYGVEGLPVWW